MYLGCINVHKPKYIRIHKSVGGGPDIMRFHATLVLKLEHRTVSGT